MDTKVDEIGTDIYRLSTFVPDVTERGFTFNQFLLTGDEPLLFHCGHRQLFPLVSEAINRVVPLEKLRWISFGHVEADECGAVNLLFGRRSQRRSHPRRAGLLGVAQRLVRPAAGGGQ
jgi:flavorubredoxin